MMPCRYSDIKVVWRSLKKERATGEKSHHRLQNVTRRIPWTLAEMIPPSSLSSAAQLFKRDMLPLIIERQCYLNQY